MFSSFIFMIEIIVAEFLFAFRLKKRENFIIKAIIFSLILLVITFLIPTLRYSWYLCLLYIFLFCLTLLMMKLLFDESWINIIFCGIAAYTTQHAAYQFTNIVFNLILWGSSPLLGLYDSNFIDISKLDLEAFLWILIYIANYFTMYTFVYFAFAKQIKKNEDFKIKNKTFLILIGGCLIFNIILNSLIVFNDNNDSFMSLVCAIFSCFCCLLLLQWQFELIHSKRLQIELDFVKKMLQQEKEQYKSMKNNIDLINLKCHDMKQQIREIGSNKRINDEAIQEIESVISIYDSVVKTENEALDIILTEKNSMCTKHKITLSCIVDGKILSFMKETDIYSLFGNALDNAIEAVMQLKDKEKRIIGIKVYSVQDLVTINIYNYFENQFVLDNDGIPSTTKEDTNYHGYGLKSMKLIVESYGGHLSVLVKDKIFNLNILLPISNK